MLSHFVIRRQFNKLKVMVYVDCEKGEADVTVSYDRKIRHSGDAQALFSVFARDLRTPEAVERWLSGPVGAHPSLIEFLEHNYRTGAFHAA